MTLHVVPADLVRHAGHVEATADQVTAAAQAGASARAGASAYGTLCGVVPMMLGTLQSALVEGITSAAESLHDTGARLRSAAAGYESTDDQRAQAMDGIRAPK
jgi:excreted virulence factor EspC (type VII ESX diderm)